MKNMLIVIQMSQHFVFHSPDTTEMMNPKKAAILNITEFMISRK